MEVGATSQRMQAASKSWKGKEKDLPLKPPEGQPHQHPDINLVRAILDFGFQECKTIHLCHMKKVYL